MDHDTQISIWHVETLMNISYIHNVASFVRHWIHQRHIGDSDYVIFRCWKIREQWMASNAQLLKNSFENTSQRVVAQCKWHGPKSFLNTFLKTKSTTFRSFSSFKTTDVEWNDIYKTKAVIRFKFIKTIWPILICLNCQRSILPTRWLRWHVFARLEFHNIHHHRTDHHLFDSSPPGQNGHHFGKRHFQMHFREYKW